jgi:hypothetical protein
MALSYKCKAGTGRRKLAKFKRDKGAHQQSHQLRHVASTERQVGSTSASEPHEVAQAKAIRSAQREKDAEATPRSSSSKRRFDDDEKKVTPSVRLRLDCRETPPTQPLPAEPMEGKGQNAVDGSGHVSSTHRVQAHRGKLDELKQRADELQGVLLDSNAFAAKFDASGVESARPSSNAAGQALRRAASSVGVAILESGGTLQQRALAVSKALELPELRDVATLIRYRTTEQQTCDNFHMDMMREMLGKAAETPSRIGPENKDARQGDAQRGRASDDQRAFVMVCATAIAPNSGDTAGVPTLAARMRHLGLSVSTSYRLLRQGKIKRDKLLTLGELNISWSDVAKRKGFSHITQDVRLALHHWIVSHPHVVNSPLMGDLIFVKDSKTGEKVKMARLLLEIPFRELHNDLIKSVEEGGLECARKDGKVVISDTSLRYFIPKQLRRMTNRHKMMCGCEICIVSRLLHLVLLAWRRRRLQELDAINKPRADKYRAQILDAEHASLYPNHVDEILCVQCPKVNGTHPHWKCVLGLCEKCPVYKVPDEEKATGDGAPSINFRVYQECTKCSVHGVQEQKAKKCPRCVQQEKDDPAAWAKLPKKPKLSTRKPLTFLTRTIGEFHSVYHVPMVKKLAYHIAYVRILGNNHCGNERLLAACLSHEVRVRRDYADRWKAEFTDEAQMEHFGNSRNLSIEGVSVESIAQATLQMYQEGVEAGKSKEELLAMVLERMELAFHCHLSDLSKQDASTTHEHMYVLMKLLMANGLLVKWATMWEDTDGCTKQAAFSFFLTLPSIALSVCITCGVFVIAVPLFARAVALVHSQFHLQSIN